MKQLNQQSHNSVNWKLLFDPAHVDNQLDQEVLLVTAKSEFLNLVACTAAEIVYRSGQRLNRQRVDFVSRVLIDSGKLTVQPHVKIDDTGITVCIDVETVDTDDAVIDSISMLADALDQLNGQHGTVYYGQPTSFEIDQLPWIAAH